MMYETMYYEGVEGCNEGIGECRKSTGPAKRHKNWENHFWFQQLCLMRV